jgi:aldose 1-epimerase
MRTAEALYGMTPDGHPVKIFTLENGRGVRVSVISYGAAIVSVEVPGRNGTRANIILSHRSIEEYVKGKEYFGCVLGRFANRITAGRFTIDGVESTLACNDGPNHIHGGRRGFDKVIWAGKLFTGTARAGIRWTHTSPSGDEGYPGRMNVTLEYTLSEASELSFEYWARTNSATPINITNHTYWNLAGSKNMLDHELTLNCPWYLPTDIGHVPTGEVRPTAGTPFDFTTAKPIARDIGAVPGGYDHCMVIGKSPGALGLAAIVGDPSSGRSMKIWTTKPGVQLYSGNLLEGDEYPRHSGFCLETQNFPDSPNRGHFPTAILRPGETYHHRTVHELS